MKRKGFTLLELLAVIIIVAIISLVAIPVISNVVNNAKMNSLKASAEGLILDEYEETGKDIFIAALIEAKDIVEKGVALQDDVDAAESNLKLAQMSLKKIEQETNSGGCGSTVLTGGVASILTLVGAAAFVMRKKEKMQ